jgi:hypothetical protein
MRTILIAFASAIVLAATAIIAGTPAVARTCVAKGYPHCSVTCSQWPNVCCSATVEIREGHGFCNKSCFPCDYSWEKKR